MNLRKPLWAVFCVAAMVLIAATAEAALYKWTDENGRVVYGDQRPASAKAGGANPGLEPADPNAVGSMAAKEAEIKSGSRIAPTPRPRPKRSRPTPRKRATCVPRRGAASGRCAKM